LQMSSLKEKAELENKANLLKLKAKYYTPEIMNQMMIEKCENMFSNLDCKNINVTNVGNGDGQVDIQGAFITQVFNSVKAIEDVMKN